MLELPATPARLRPGCLQSPTLLDCIFHELANTYYVVDVLIWNGCDLSDCTLECRLAFWVHSKLAELPQLSGQEHGLAALPFAPFSAGELLPACCHVHQAQSLFAGMRAEALSCPAH